MNILLTSIGRRAYMVQYFRKALRGSGKVHAANSSFVVAMQLADHSVITPLIYDPGYINFLINYCVDNKIDAIIPLFDIDLPVLARNKAKFSEHNITVVVSDYKVTEICNDKWDSTNFLIENDFKCPASYISIESCLTALREKTISYPLIVKPRWGMGSIGIFHADNDEELIVLYGKSRKMIFDSYLKYESGSDPENDVIIQEKKNGQEYGLDVLNDLQGNFLTCVPKKKIAMRAGETDIAEIIDHAELFELGKRISQKLKHVGNLDIDLIINEEAAWILDMNCRFGGQYPFIHQAGADFPQAIVNMLMNKEVTEDLLTVKNGITVSKLLDLKKWE
jgi:carbamoyl-phosphate synthase large subunit